MVKTIEMTYRKAPGFDWLYPELAGALQTEHRFICELNQMLIKLLAAKLSLNCSFVRSSDMNLSADLPGDEVICQIVSQLGGTVYVSGRGAGSARYINEEVCAARNIELQYMNFLALAYPQLHGQYTLGRCRG